MSNYTRYTFAERPDRAEEADALCPTVWPEFMLQDLVANSNWGYLTDEFAAFQFFLCDESDAIVAVGNSIPVTWDGSPETLPNRGWDAVFEQGVANLLKGIAPTVLSALQAVVVSGQQGKGLSAEVIRGMQEIAAQHGLGALIAPVRPSKKSDYPLTPMERYIRWARPDGLPFDPWLRVHHRMGAKTIKVAHRSMKIPGSLADWESWTGMRFPESGKYIVPGALNPVTMNLEKNLGVYIEPNVWMVHEISDRLTVDS